MAEIVTLELPETLVQQAKEIAAFTHRRLEDVLVEWIDRAIAELPVESLPDEQVLALCDMQMESEEQEVFSDLLNRNREGQLSDTEVSRLDELMKVYRRGLVRKARAIELHPQGSTPAVASHQQEFYIVVHLLNKRFR